MSALPTGTVTFLLTDVVGSAKLWEERPEGMRAALARRVSGAADSPRSWRRRGSRCCRSSRSPSVWTTVSGF